MVPVLGEGAKGDLRRLSQRRTGVEGTVYMYIYFCPARQRIMCMALKKNGSETISWVILGGNNGLTHDSLWFGFS